MAGYDITDSGVNNSAGQITRALWDNLDAAHRFYLWLNDATNTDAALVARGVGQANLDIIRPAFADLGGPSGLWAVAHGTYDPSGVNNFFFNAKKLTGVTYAG
jgi:hypothetical protein